MGVPLVYTLRDGNLYGTERMALATAAGLAAEGFDPTLIAPPGPALARAAAAGWTTLAFEGWAGFAAALTRVLSAHRRLAFLATDVKHSLAFAAANLAFRRRSAHVHPSTADSPPTRSPTAASVSPRRPARCWWRSATSSDAGYVRGDAITPRRPRPSRRSSCPTPRGASAGWHG
jgi:hypothetical protein